RQDRADVLADTTAQAIEPGAEFAGNTPLAGPYAFRLRSAIEEADCPRSFEIGIEGEVVETRERRPRRWRQARPALYAFAQRKRPSLAECGELDHFGRPAEFWVFRAGKADRIPPATTGVGFPLRDDAGNRRG